MSSPLPYRTLFLRMVSVSFVIGAGVELFMIYGRIGNETFYQTATRLEAERRPERLRKAKELQELIEQKKREREESNRGDTL